MYETLFRISTTLVFFSLSAEQWAFSNVVVVDVGGSFRVINCGFLYYTFSSVLFD